MTVGRYLKSQREARGEDVATVASMLRIHPNYLSALEEDEVEKLPGPTYAVGFVRAYAEYLELDGDKVVERFKEEGKGIDTRSQLVFPSPLPEGRIPSGALLMLAVLFIAVAYGGWLYVSSFDNSLVDAVPALPDRLAALVEGDRPQGTAPIDVGAGETRPVARVDDGLPQPSQPAPAPPPQDAPADLAGTPPAATVPGDAVTTEIVGRTETDAPSAAASPAAPVAAATLSVVASEPAAETDAPSDAPPATATETAAAAVASQVENTAAAPAGTGAETMSGPTEGQVAATNGSSEVTRTLSSAAGEAAAGSGGPAIDAVATRFPPDPPLPSRESSTTVYGEENAGARIVIRAVGDSWVEVRDREGELLLTRVLRVGDTYRVPDRSGLTLVTGNAGGLEFVVDGTTVPSIGPIGTVRRNVLLDPAALKSGDAHLR